MNSTMLRRMGWTARLALLWALPLAGAGCHGGANDCAEGEICEDAGSLPPDFCNTQDEADHDAEHCLLTVNDVAGATRKTDLFISRLADAGLDQDWYLATMPATMNGRSLLHINAGYSAPQTRVNFKVNVLTAGANGQLTSIATGVDNHGAAAPKPVDLVVPFATPGAKVYLLVGDGAGDARNVDNRNPYSVFVQVLDNPDTNEPNETPATATPIAMAAGAGRATGYLATPDDVDEYSFPVTAKDRTLLYLHISEVLDGGAVHPSNPPPPYRLSYTLTNPAGTQVSEGHMEDEFLKIDLATARAMTAASSGTWHLQVRGYKEAGSVGGDPRIAYAVELRVLDDLDANEPNDTLATAVPWSPTGLGATQLKGKISTVPDEEWFKVTLPSRATPSTLRYKLSLATTGGRFEPLTAGQRLQGPNRFLRVLSALPAGVSASDCSTKPAVCPRSYTSASSAPDASRYVASFCGLATPLCLFSQRQAEQHQDLRNGVGAIPVPASGGTFYVVLRDEGQGVAKYADDRDWTIDLTWADDPDEGTATRTVSLSGATSSSTGELTYGYGGLLDPFAYGQGVRGSAQLDYDAYETDTDLWEVGFGGASGAQGWAFEWDIEHGSGGELAFDLTFCGAADAGSGGAPCTGVTKLLGYNGSPATPWYKDATQASNATALFTRTDTMTATAVAMNPVGCWCFGPTEVATGHFFLNVRGVNRTSNEPIRYTLKQSVGAYPGFFSSGVCAAAATCGFSSH